ncbi:MAG: hypothetical protein WDM81_02390 [Rhizomicrobium sp.]
MFAAWQRRILPVLLVWFLLLGVGGAAPAADPLPSWNDGPVKTRIEAFVAAAVQPGGAGFIEPSDRIAMFDNDGTLWAEQPLYFQFLFALDRVKALAPQHPEWKTQQPFKAVLDGDLKTLAASGEKGLVALLMATHTGMTTDRFTVAVTNWLATARHPGLKRAYTDLVLSADARASGLSARQRLQDLHRLGRHGGVHARLRPDRLRRPARAGDRHDVRDAVRSRHRRRPVAGA